ncbi:putative helicase MAGATAMA 3 [Hibiscus syriacus]|uniref:Helicase MAGATAMA 3 n=1 Tax=Hibiscus syriacus TaxID=106335 RepID=A0A6A3AU45_HIBSY|nr:putative helicase MAGATAMA 3 [Hibiscus syriacus]
MHSKGGLLELKCGPELPIEEKYKHWGRASPWLMSGNPRDLIMPIDGDDGFFPTSGNEMKPEVVNSSRKYRLRVLVCAPSNSALDEIIFRLLKTGVRDENVRAYTPKIVRIGLKPHHSVEAVSQRCCEYLVLFSSSNSSLKGCNYQVVELSVTVEMVWYKIIKIVVLVNSDVGDPVQLPATVISPVAEKLGYGTSLFKRFQRAGYPVKMLKTQYRMHPEIRSFPSKEFYDEALEDGSDVQDQTTREWHKYRYFGPFCFFDIHEGKESQPSGSGSWVNTDEIEFVLAIHQVKLLQEKFQEMFGVESKKVADIGTIDGFQGREKDVIFSCVRASKDRGIGFVADFRRMNVGITRAKSSVLVVGSASTLKRDEHWSNLVESAEKRDCLFKVVEMNAFENIAKKYPGQVGKPYASFLNDEYLESMKAVTKDAQMVDEMDNEETNVPYNAGGDADQAPVEDNDYGEGYGDGDVGGFITSGSCCDSLIRFQKKGMGSHKARIPQRKILVAVGLILGSTHCTC